MSRENDSTLPEQAEEWLLDSTVSPEIVSRAISFPIVKVVKTTRSAYEVQFGSEKFEIIRGDQDEYLHIPYDDPRLITGGGVFELRMVQRQPRKHIEINDSDRSFRKIRMFHEIREWQYRARRGLGKEEAHVLTVRDEKAYILQHMKKGKRERYLAYAEARRNEAQEEREAKEARVRIEKERVEAVRRNIITAFTEVGFSELSGLLYGFPVFLGPFGRFEFSFPRGTQLLGEMALTKRSVHHLVVPKEKHRILNEDLNEKGVTVRTMNSGSFSAETVGIQGVTLKIACDVTTQSLNTLRALAAKAREKIEAIFEILELERG